MGNIVWCQSIGVLGSCCSSCITRLIAWTGFAFYIRIEYGFTGILQSWLLDNLKLSLLGTGFILAIVLLSKG